VKQLIAEFLGTFALVFAGTGAIVIDNVSGGSVTHLGIALTFGLIVLAMIYTLGDISGAHINPAVTIGFWAARRFDARSVLPYLASQCAGALVASITLRLLFPTDLMLGATIPAAQRLSASICKASGSIFSHLPLAQWSGFSPAAASENQAAANQSSSRLFRDQSSGQSEE